MVNDASFGRLLNCVNSRRGISSQWVSVNSRSVAGRRGKLWEEKLKPFSWIDSSFGKRLKCCSNPVWILLGQEMLLTSDNSRSEAGRRSRSVSLKSFPFNVSRVMAALS